MKPKHFFSLTHFRKRVMWVRNGRAEIKPFNDNFLLTISNAERKKLECSSNNTLLNDIRIATYPQKWNRQAYRRAEWQISDSLSFPFLGLMKCENLRNKFHLSSKLCKRPSTCWKFCRTCAKWRADMIIIKWYVHQRLSCKLADELGDTWEQNGGNPQSAEAFWLGRRRWKSRQAGRVSY